MLVNFVVLEKDVCLREKMYMAFPFKVKNFIIRLAISHFQININNIVKYMKHFYFCYSQFIDLSKLEIFFNKNYFIMIALKLIYYVVKILISAVAVLEL